MKRWIAAVCVGCVVAAGGGGAEGAAVGLGGWMKVFAGGGTRCARGGPYAFWIRKGDPQRLLIFFQGGGAASPAP